MQKYRAAGAGNRRVVIMAQNHDEVVEIIVSPQGFMAGIERPNDGLVVARVFRVVAPTIDWRQGCDGQSGFRFREAVSAIHHAAQRVATYRRRAVPFGFIGADTRSAECAPVGPIPP